ncbi:hypothetical protein N7466_004259 [Penicillium verhagenii]|uniref:uncharacterized protein n=1 Tax=Penicillium verhagenii TaxID=1562060 RepID=UPI002545AA0A|nr:uncharacterized protein N7466_004259 [Penicillium verhagenii]KAJ5934712.1 hypothetical protein N7466_004259 [Penicillium verhagenii]
MARFNLSFLAVFLFLAVFALSLPTKRDELSSAGQALGLDKTFDQLKSATKIMNNVDQKDVNNEKNEVDDDADVDQDSSDDEEPEATKTEKKLTSGNFATPTATSTHKPTSKPNALGKLPIVGGLLGGTGAF